MIYRTPFPSISEAAASISGLWIWSDTSGDDPRLCLLKFENTLFASFEQRRVCLAAGLWHIDSGCAVKFEMATGSQVLHMNTDMPEEEKGERVWMYLEAECATLLLERSVAIDEVEMGFVASRLNKRCDLNAISDYLMAEVRSKG